MPLNAAARAQFNETAAIEFFTSMEGLPYGFHNFLFGWIDTVEDNLPPLMPPGMLPIVMSILEDVLPKQADIFFGQSINKRLGTKGLNIKELAAEAARRNTSIEELMSVIEVEGWEYEGFQPKDGRAYVCSAFVAALYQAGGLLRSVNSPEFTPRDLYILDIFDKTYQRPQECVQADPDLPYCQIIGRFRMDHPGYSTIKPYEHMAERFP